MGSVASFGSVNLDRVARVDRGTINELAVKYDWFPEPGETRLIESIPAAVIEYADMTYLGGKGANQAVAAAAAGADAAMYGCVGDDRGQVDPRTRLAEQGVDTTAVQVANAPTGTAGVFVDSEGENRIVVVGGANDAVGPAYVKTHVGTLRQHDCLLVQHELPTATIDTLLTALDGTADRPTVIFDPSPAGGAAPLLGHDCVDIVTPNRAEADTLEAALAKFDGTVIRTQGADGVTVSGPTGEITVTPPSVDVVDTTGAGDVLAGYLAAGLATDDPLTEAVERGCVAAALSVTQEGVQRATPTAEATEAMRSEPCGRQRT